MQSVAIVTFYPYNTVIISGVFLFYSFTGTGAGRWEYADMRGAKCIDTKTVVVC